MLLVIASAWLVVYSVRLRNNGDSRCMTLAYTGLQKSCAGCLGERCVQRMGP